MTKVARDSGQSSMNSPIIEENDSHCGIQFNQVGESVDGLAILVHSDTILGTFLYLTNNSNSNLLQLFIFRLLVE
jgi:hypothetical protein